ncbi:hypothetical protein QAD02_024433 [Eretmocerus hayati]|uniref:Uncharacterized protein n=1 Tax=Eretmocerus hayati TaxID=131215 RepID=A0ACC2PZQ9_9HYME|nr:hypothetical protein QAD02_024433 [Eretmocerus hayati]
MGEKGGGSRTMRSALGPSSPGPAEAIRRSSSADRNPVFARMGKSSVAVQDRTAPSRHRRTAAGVDRGGAPASSRPHPVADVDFVEAPSARVVQAAGIQARFTRRKNHESRSAQGRGQRHAEEHPLEPASEPGNLVTGSHQRNGDKTRLEQHPRRGSGNLGDSSKGEMRSSAADDDSESTGCCNCANCKSLLHLAECGVCWECLQGGQICACPVCANVVCSSCSARLSTCPFCRSSEPHQRDRALERLVDALVLPCRNARSGCDSLLDGESRFAHESMCPWATIGCPVGRGGCSWHGTVASVRSHLLERHQLQPLHDHGISVEIHSFRNKASAQDGRVYTVCLCCFGQLFVVRLVLCESRLRLCFTRLGPVDPDGSTKGSKNEISDEANSRFGVSVTIRARSGRRLRGLVPFGRFDRDSRELSISCDSLYPSRPASSEDAAKRLESSLDNSQQQSRVLYQNSDLVKVDLMLKRLDRH